jgi:DNA-directed RNA polymerase specialized sigma24 family protein
VLRAVQRGIFALSVRMLGNVDDARDATQEVLVKVATRLSSFRGDSVLRTWVHRIAVNHLLDVLAARASQPPQQSFEELADLIDAGLRLAERRCARPVRSGASSSRCASSGATASTPITGGAHGKGSAISSP